MSPRCRPNLLRHLSVARQALAQRPSGLFTDVDGTLSPIVPSPEQAHVPEITKHLLARLAERLDLVAVISGRPAREVRMLVGLDQLVYVGNHGLERWQAGEVRVDPRAAPFLPLITRVTEELQRRLATIPGVRVEPKGITTSVHYRQAPDHAAARAAILEAIKRIPVTPQLRVTEGRMVVNLLPPLDLNKGTAVLALAREYALRGALYLGDDTTDIDALAALRHLRAEGVATVGVAVVSAESPPELRDVADYEVTGITGVQRLLQALSGGEPRSQLAVMQ